MCSLSLRTHQECVEESFVPTMRTLFHAPATSPLSEVDTNNVAELFVELTRSSAPTPVRTALTSRFVRRELRYGRVAVSRRVLYSLWVSGSERARLSGRASV